MIRSLLLAGLVGGASATLTNTTRQTLLPDRLTNQSLLGSGGRCSDLGRHCNQNNNNCTSQRTGSRGCSRTFSFDDWLCGSEATCCVPDGSNLFAEFNDGDAHFCDGASATPGPTGHTGPGDIGTNDYCCSGQCCSYKRNYITPYLAYKCGTDC